MNSKTGYKETTAVICIVSLSLSMMALPPLLCRLTNSGAWINMVVNIIFFIPVIAGIFFYLKNMSGDIIYDAFSVWGNTGKLFVGILFFVFSINYASFLFEFCLKNLLKTVPVISEELHSEVIITVATIGAYLGIEANTRSSYLMIVPLLTGFILCIAATNKAWDTRNMYPLFGNDLKTTFADAHSLIALSGLGFITAIGNCFKNTADEKKCLISSFIIVSLLNIVFLFVYILSLPYPVNSLGDISTKGMFSLMSSGEIFHRIEIFIVALFQFAGISALAFCIYVCSAVICKIIDFKDNKPFTLVVGALVYTFSFFDISLNSCVELIKWLSLPVFTIPIILCITNKICKKRVI